MNEEEAKGTLTATFYFSSKDCIKEERKGMHGFIFNW